MSQQEELTEMRMRVDDLMRRVGQLERTVDQLRGVGTTTRADRPQKAEQRQMVTVPDTPYNEALWKDTDDEGLGMRDRHAP
ncbi:hypothetical protein QCN29_34795 [Streptomyces sp. HNM0663]|uniref:Uncharacterized protein n=1 Tax=Streptomyces chengmaiensis TaxID=3040919 RepID=A0ABT6HZI6_9ACTN|nr:hypothetical protein [Streptomyces chengmaiensis]MDH2393835.1 hypothetical protein [Streptomyces chengmaiensis]